MTAGSDTSTGTARGDAPVFLVFKDGRMGEQLAGRLRDFGLRTRHAVNLDVFRNAAAATPPSAVVLDDELLPDDATSAVLEDIHASGRCGPAPLVVVGRNDGVEQRLRAVRAGAQAWFTRPFNPSVLAHRLHQLRGLGAAEHLHALLVDDTGALADTGASLQTGGMTTTVLDDPMRLLDQVRANRPDILLVSGDLAAVDAAELMQMLRQDSRHYGLPALILTAGDKRRFDGLAARAGIDGVVGLPVPATDLTAIVRSRLERVAGLQSSARYLARRDPDTGLDSPGHVLEELRQALALSRGNEQRTTLLYLQVEAAEAAAGRDPRVQRALMVATARRLQILLPATALAARIDEGAYAALLFGADAAELEHLTARLQEALEQQAPATRARLGLTLLRADLSNADAALARARDAALAGDTAAEPATTGDATAETIDWSGPLTNALDRGRFRLVYQPIASLSGTPVSVYEVFVRMLDEQGGEVLPQEFLPAAQRLGLTTPLDRWIVGQAVDVLASQARRDHRPILFVKLFPETVADSRFPRWLADQLREQGVPGDRLVFQLTQEAAATHLAETAALMDALQPLGCALALEHYGARADGNNLLQRLPLKYIKLSPALTREIGTDPTLRADVQAITSQARSAGVRTVAALVQDASSLSVLWGAGVDYIQGYFMQAPSDVFAGE